MQLADRQGFVIIDEVPAVGMNMFMPGAPDIFTKERVNEKTLEHHKTVLKELYQRDKNHPCVVMWRTKFQRGKRTALFHRSCKADPLT